MDRISPDTATIVTKLPSLLTMVGQDEVKLVGELVAIHDRHYTSINFGEDVIKEMIMSSVFGIPVSAKVNKIHAYIRMFAN